MSDPAVADSISTILGLGGGAGGGVMGTLLIQRLLGKNQSNDPIKVEGTDQLLHRMDTMINSQHETNLALARLEGAVSRMNGHGG